MYLEQAISRHLIPVLNRFHGPLHVPTVSETDVLRCTEGAKAFGAVRN